MNEKELTCEVCDRFFSEIAWSMGKNLYKCPVCGTKYRLRLDIQSSTPTARGDDMTKTEAEERIYGTMCSYINYDNVVNTGVCDAKYCPDTSRFPCRYRTQEQIDRYHSSASKVNIDE